MAMVFVTAHRRDEPSLAETSLLVRGAIANATAMDAGREGAVAGLGYGVTGRWQRACHQVEVSFLERPRMGSRGHKPPYTNVRSPACPGVVSNASRYIAQNCKSRLKRRRATPNVRLWVAVKRYCAELYNSGPSELIRR